MSVGRRPLIAAAAVVALVGGAFGFYWFEPWKLFVDSQVSEDLPAAAQGPLVRTLAEGKFRSLEHETTGVAKVLQTEDGSQILRFEDLSTSNGPQLVVMLSATPATEASWTAYDDGEHVILGPLRGNRGSQNYDIPKDVDLSRYKSAVVWCKRFSVGFGAAPLGETP
jgi:hypothetical protein